MNVNLRDISIKLLLNYYICWEIDNFVIKSDIFRRFFICKNILKKLSCYHNNYFRYFMFWKYNGFVSRARVSACMYFLVMYIWFYMYCLLLYLWSEECLAWDLEFRSHSCRFRHCRRKVFKTKSYLFDYLASTLNNCFLEGLSIYQLFKGISLERLACC
jgi:hypothetical protein